ncbi:MAG: FtsX-like permease family protein [Chlamydiae bacterium]|nr:FtsX-like permease family protein [Chlamydiota bacterium]
MLKLALKMLIGDKAKYIAIILGLSFAAFIITQQSAIFVGLMARTYGFITDTSQPNIWVMDSKLQFVDDIKPLKDTKLYKVRGIPGVKWAVPMYKGLINAKLKDGTYQTCNIVGIDESTLIGGPPIILEGKLSNLRQTDAIIVNKVGANDKLAMRKKIDGKNVLIPLKVSDVLEVNDKRAKVVGICDVLRTFQSQPVLYTTLERAYTFAPKQRLLLSFILARSEDSEDVKTVCNRIKTYTDLNAYTQKEFEWLTIVYYMKKTGILINFGVAVLLGFIIGTAIAGQTFHNFVSDNTRFLAVLKAMGSETSLLIRMTLLQVLFSGSIGWGLGVGAAAFFGFIARHTELAFKLSWQLYIFSGLAMLFICSLAAFVSIAKISKIEPAVAFKD